MSVMRQDWHHLLFLHWEIPAAELQALVPPELTIDTFQGKAYAGVIPFTLSNVRPVLTPPIPFLSRFHEVNVRTYVRRGDGDPGVWFFSLDTSSGLAVDGARAFYHLPYFHSQIQFSASDDPLPEIDYVARRDDPTGARPADLHVRYRPVEGPVQPAPLGTLEHFLIERYVLYAMDKSHNLHRARVHHEPYAVQRAEAEVLEETLVWAAGIRRAETVPLRHYAREVNVYIDPPQRVQA